MADFNLPVLATGYSDVLDDLKARDVNAITLCLAAPSNTPTGAIKWNRVSFVFQEWSGAAFVTVTLAVAGGGTGATTAAGARTNLGLGTIATQDSNNVSISGGAVAADLGGSTDIPATALSGLVPQANLGSGSAGAGAKFLADDQTFKFVGLSFIPTLKNADYTILNTDITSKKAFKITGLRTITLPNTNDATIDGFLLPIANLGVADVTLTPFAGNTIGLATTFTLYAGTASSQGDSVILICDKTGGNWIIQ